MAIHRDLLSLLTAMGEYPAGTVFELSHPDKSGRYMRCMQHVGHHETDAVKKELAKGTGLSCVPHAAQCSACARADFGTFHVDQMKVFSRKTFTG